MEKLPKGALEDIKFSEVKNILIKNKEEKEFKEYFRLFILNVLKGNETKKIKESDFQALISYFS